MKRALAHLFNRLLSICYRGWVSLIELSHIEREQKQKRAVAMMTMRGCVRYPNSNPAPAPAPGPDPDADPVPNPKSTLNPNPNPNPNPNQVRCFVAWLGHVNEMRTLRQRAMAHFSGNLAFFAFSAWRTFQAEQRERHKNFGIRMRRGGEWRALCKWVAFREAKLERARQRLQAEEEAAAAEAAEVADEEARLSRAQEMERLRAMANDCAERQAEAVAQLEEAAVQAHEAEQPELLRPFTVPLLNAVQGGLRKYGQPVFDALANPSTVKTILKEPYANAEQAAPYRLGRAR